MFGSAVHWVGRLIQVSNRMKEKKKGKRKMMEQVMGPCPLPPHPL